MDGVTYLFGGILPCRPSDEGVWLWRGEAAPSLTTTECLPKSAAELAGSCHTKTAGANLRTRWRPQHIQELNFHIPISPSIPGTRLELVRPEGRGILSPLRLPIPPPGRATPTQCSGLGGVPQRKRAEPSAALRQRALRAHPTPCPPLLPLPADVLQALAKLILNTEILRSLSRCHER